MRITIEPDSRVLCNDKPWKISDLIRFLEELKNAGYEDYYICGSNEYNGCYVCRGARAIIPENMSEVYDFLEEFEDPCDKADIKENGYKHMHIIL